MKINYKKLLQQRLAKESKRALKLLWPVGAFAWEDTEAVVQLMNDLLKDIPVEVWPKNKKDMEDSVHLKQGDWYLTLYWNENEANEKSRRTADLAHKKDDHTAWVIEHSKDKGRFIDFDIGGS